MKRNASLAADGELRDCRFREQTLAVRVPGQSRQSPIQAGTSSESDDEKDARGITDDEILDILNAEDSHGIITAAESSLQQGARSGAVRDSSDPRASRTDPRYATPFRPANSTHGWHGAAASNRNEARNTGEKGPSPSGEDLKLGKLLAGLNCVILPFLAVSLWEQDPTTAATIFVSWVAVLIGFIGLLLNKPWGAIVLASVVALNLTETLGVMLYIWLEGGMIIDNGNVWIMNDRGWWILFFRAFILTGFLSTFVGAARALSNPE